MINDSDLIGSGASGGSIMPGGCKFFGTCITTKKFTYFIDVSGSMLQRNSQGVTLMEVAKTELINQIRAIPLNQGWMLQVYKFNHTAVPVFDRPMEVDGSVRQKAIDFVSALYARGGTFPFNGISESIQKKDVEQMIILSDGITYDNGTCFHNGQRMKFADCFAQYNQKIRDNDPSIPSYKTKPVVIDAVSLVLDFCAGSNVPWYYSSWWGLNSKWLGELASKNDGTCTHIQ